MDILYRLVPQLTPLDFFSWDVVHWHELCGVHMRGGMKKRNFQNFFIHFLAISTSEITIPPKKIGVRRCLGELGVSEGRKTKWRISYFFFRFPGLGVGPFRVRICFVVFVGEFELSAAVGFRSRVCSGYL